MRRCNICKGEIADGAVVCRHCGEEQFPFEKVIVTSSDRIEGYEIYEYIDTLYGETVVPNGLLGAITNGTFFTISALTDARIKSMDALKQKAKKIGANAVIGLDIDISDLNGNGMMVSANGTAVYVMPSYYKETLKEKRIEELEKIKSDKENRIKFEEAKNEIINNVLANNGYGDLSASEMIVVKFLLRCDNGANAISISSAMPRSVNPADLANALKSLKDKGVVTQSETGYYSMNLNVSE